MAVGVWCNYACKECRWEEIQQMSSASQEGTHQPPRDGDSGGTAVGAGAVGDGQSEGARADCQAVLAVGIGRGG